MNNESFALLNKLASKLGTTVEYLWSILLKQAPISATIDVLFFFITGMLVFIWVKVHLKFTDDERVYSYYNKEEMLVVPMALAFIVLFAFSIDSLCSIPNIINGYFNPEYWALNEIFKHLK